MSKQTLFGVIPSPIDLRDYKINALSAEQFPETFELPYVRVKSQGNVSSCVAHALSEAVEYFNSVQKDNKDLMSVMWIYGNRRNSICKKEGMIIRDALSNLISFGEAKYDDFPGNSEYEDAIEKFEANVDNLKAEALKNRINGYYRVKTVDEIKTALMTQGPVICSVMCYSDWIVKNGVLTSARKFSEREGRHCMMIYGWNETGWLVLNSWGVWWGNSGTCVIPYDYKLGETWGLTDNIVDTDDGVIIKPFSSKLGEVLLKILSFILNIFKLKK